MNATARLYKCKSDREKAGVRYCAPLTPLAVWRAEPRGLMAELGQLHADVSRARLEVRKMRSTRTLSFLGRAAATAALSQHEA